MSAGLVADYGQGDWSEDRLVTALRKGVQQAVTHPLLLQASSRVAGVRGQTRRVNLLDRLNDAGLMGALVCPLLGLELLSGGRPRSPLVGPGLPRARRSAGPG
ncbi:hypothetical protein MNEG_6942 [Monoraphidium neglectum]|uniref:Uncharacterized protein n=1 Tax=Monoraphidium neglectum TaxID=145388 RepID=A0A0D2MCS9_9CHLO|nr:hypothetical protein MNEG_6942 [Monoraphidium neglectum]KIZ01020.1 hypothetical protein MNEG_6942 [Monoraphidium neglectum]|eukprot:XP_013900039.1 hypothetical protein MNEG_6942 [Monoraphidium neglectum]